MGDVLRDQMDRTMVRDLVSCGVYNSSAMLHAFSNGKGPLPDQLDVVFLPQMSFSGGAFRL